MMRKRNLFYELVGSSLVAAFVLTSCNAAATPPATASVAATQSPVVPTQTATIAPTLTETPIPLPTDTLTPTATEPPTPTFQLTPQVNPGMNAFCRKGPGTGYYAITYLQVGTYYDVIGQNGINTWWLVQVPQVGNITCWMGDPTSVMQGPVWDVPVVLVAPIPGVPQDFVSSYACSSAAHTLTVQLNWSPQENIGGYSIYRNGSLLKKIAPNATGFKDNDPPWEVDVVYQVSAFNDLGESDSVSVTIPACGV
jgi:hypothetical protein